MTQNDAPWPPWRTKRLLELMTFKARGYSDERAGKALSRPISRSTVGRELNSPQAAELGRQMRAKAALLAWALTERQLQQIETDKSITPGQKLIYRGQMIQMLLSQSPRLVEQKVSGELSQEVKMIDVTEEDLLTVAYPVLREILRREARPTDEVLAKEDPEESVD